MSRSVGVKILGIRAPIIRENDDLESIVVDSLLQVINSEKLNLNDNDVLGITESLLARAQGNYVTLDDISNEIKTKFPSEIGVVFPILSRNRFSLILKAVARAASKVHLFLSYPSDEVGNHLFDPDLLEDMEIDTHCELLTEQRYRNLFRSNTVHPFTGIDYVSFYKQMANENNISVYLTNNLKSVLNITEHILVADIHTRNRTKKILAKLGAKTVIGLDELCNKQTESRGFNKEYGLLGSNKATEEKIKLFPRDGQSFVNGLQAKLKNITGKNIEVMIYGDGAFKDPVGKIWELADPVVSPAYTNGLSGMPNELKLKFLADDKLGALSGVSLSDAMKNEIKSKPTDLIGNMAAEGTTPRRLTDLLGSLCDLTSGSGDKGTPIVLIQGYFDNFASE